MRAPTRPPKRAREGSQVQTHMPHHTQGHFKRDEPNTKDGGAPHKRPPSFVPTTPPPAALSSRAGGDLPASSSGRRGACVQVPCDVMGRWLGGALQAMRHLPDAVYAAFRSLITQIKRTNSPRRRSAGALSCCWTGTRGRGRISTSSSTHPRNRKQRRTRRRGGLWSGRWSESTSGNLSPITPRSLRGPVSRSSRAGRRGGGTASRSRPIGGISSSSQPRTRCVYVSVNDARVCTFHQSLSPSPFQ